MEFESRDHRQSQSQRISISWNVQIHQVTASPLDYPTIELLRSEETDESDQLPSQYEDGYIEQQEQEQEITVDADGGTSS